MNNGEAATVDEVDSAVLAPPPAAVATATVEPAAEEKRKLKRHTSRQKSAGGKQNPGNLIFCVVEIGVRFVSQDLAAELRRKRRHYCACIRQTSTRTIRRRSPFVSPRRLSLSSRLRRDWHFRARKYRR